MSDKKTTAIQNVPLDDTHDEATTPMKEASTSRQRGFSIKQHRAALQAKDAEAIEQARHIDFNSLPRDMQELAVKHWAEVNREALAEAMKPMQPRPVFTAKPYADVIHDGNLEPPSPKLFGQLIVKGEVGLLFAEPGVGKSILAPQIAMGVAAGEEVILPGANHPDGTPIGSECVPTPSAVYDFELSPRQIAGRYTNKESGQEAAMPDNCYRVSMDYSAAPGGRITTEMVLRNIREMVECVKVGFVVIDNITYLCQTAEKGADAAQLITSIKLLSRETGVTVLLVAHTPKRDRAQPITMFSMGGSAMLVNLVDYQFAIGASAIGSDLCYIKQLKGGRNGEGGNVFGQENVITCRRIKTSDGKLILIATGTGPEREHLYSPVESARADRNAQIRELSKNGLSERAIAKQIGMSAAGVHKVLNRAAEEEEPPF